jgi:hypothetical protein
MFFYRAAELRHTLGMGSVVALATIAEIVFGVAAGCGGVTANSSTSGGAGSAAKDASSGAAPTSRAIGGSLGMAGTGGLLGTGGTGPSDAGAGASSGAAVRTFGSAHIEFSVSGTRSYCTHDCRGVSIEIQDSKGQTLERNGACRLACATCILSPCPAIPCLPDSAFTGAQLDWDGIYYYSALPACRPGSTCLERAIARPGEYTAKLCATPGLVTGMHCVATGPDECSSVKFTYPSAELVTGVLGDAVDGG